MTPRKALARLKLLRRINDFTHLSTKVALTAKSIVVGMA
jgi:hypothetical protein